MSDPDQRRGGLAERRDSFVQAPSATERGGGESAGGAAQHSVRGGASVRANGPSLLAGHGEMGERIRQYDWAGTPLGPIEQWPACLKNALEIILHSPVPMSINWGESGILLYNDAMIPVLGVLHPRALGMDAMDAWPEHARWTERVMRQVLAGQSLSLHNQCMETRRSGMREQSWFDLDYSPILDEAGDVRGMLGVTIETTDQVEAAAERERLDASLRASEARQRFVLAFTDRVRGLTDPQTVMSEAAAALGAHLQASRCGYAEVRPDMQQIEVRAEWTEAAQTSKLGVQSIAGSNRTVRADFQSGKTLVVRDTQNDAREAVREHIAAYQGWDARAVIAAPLIHHGRWVALLYVTDSRPRAWSKAEIGLIEEMAARVWDVVERTRAEAAVRDSEADLRALFEAVPAAVFACDRNAVIQAYNARATELWGRSPVRGADKRGSLHMWSADGSELPPDYSPTEEVLRSGRKRQLELTIGRADGTRTPVLADYSPLKNADGEVTGAIVAFNDISERKRRESELALLADIGEVTAHCDDEAQIIQAVSQRIGPHMGLHCCCLISVDEAQQHAVVDQVWYEGEIPKLPRHAPLADFVIPSFTDEARTGKPIVVNDCYADSRTNGDAYARYEIAAYISIPWHEDAHWRGLLAFADDAPREWSQHEIALACELANRIMPRLQRVRAQAALRTSQAQMAGRVSDLERLHALGTRLMQQDDLESVLREVMDAAKEMLHADRCSVQLCEKGRLRRIASSGLPQQAPGERFHIVADDEITTCAAALRAHERIVVEDFARDPRFTEMAAVFAPLGARAGISTPLLAGDGSVIAMFSLYFDKPWRQDHWALRMLDLYAQQAAVQIERVRKSRNAAWLAAIVTSSHDAIISKNLDGIITTWNHGAELLFGYTPEEVIGKPVTILMPPDRVNEEPGILARIRAGEVVDHYETVRRRKDGTLLDVSLTVAPVHDAHGAIIGASKIARDITARKQAERAMRESDRRFRALLNASSDAVYSMSADWREMRHLQGHSFITDTEVVKPDWLDDYIPEDERPRVREAINAAIHDRCMFELEHRVLRADGSEGWTLSRAVPVLDEKNEIVEWFGMASDITARVHAERDAARLAAIVTSTYDAVYSADLEGVITTWNHGAELLLGYTQEEVIGRPFTLLMPEGRESEEADILARVRVGEVVNNFETVRRHKNGSLLNVSLTVSPIRDMQGTIIGASNISHDITARVQAELGHLESLIRERNAREEAEILVESARLLSSELEYEELAQNLTDLATRLTGAQYGAFFHNVATEEGESYMLYTLSGAERSDFANMPMPTKSPLFKPVFQGRGPLRCGDVRKHPDFGKGKYQGPPPGHLPVTSFLALPVKSRSGKVYGGLFFAHAEPNMFDERAERLVEGIAAQAAIALDNVRAYTDIAESEARFRQMIDALPMPVYTTDPQGRITHFNPATVEFAGRTPEPDTDAWTVGWKLYRADGSPIPREHSPMAIALKQERPIFGGIEVIAERPDGGRRWFTPYPTPLHDAHGKLVGGINMLVDISERKRQEQALMEAHLRTESQRRLYETILDNTPDLAYIFDLEHRFTYANAILLKMWGKTWDEAIGKTCWELGYPDWHAAMHDREIEQVIATKLPVRGQVPFTGTFGERTYEYVFVPVLGLDGEVEAVAGTTRDVTDQKEIEQNLRAEEERKSFLLKLTDTLRNLRDPDEVQRQACEALGTRFGCDRVYVAEISEGEDRVLVLPDYHRPDLPSVAGEYDLAGMEELLTALRGGQPLVVDDAAKAPLPQPTRAMLDSLGIRALVANVLIKSGRLSWALLAGHSQPREWKPEEVTLMADVMDRTWDAVQRAQAVNALHDAHAQAEQHARTLDSTLSSVLDLVFRFTPDGRFDYANQALLDLWGVTAEQASGKSMAELGYPPEIAAHMLREIAKVIATGAPVKGETPYESPTGGPGRYAYKLVPLFDAEGQVAQIAGTALDITDRKRNELLLTEQKNLLELIATGCELPQCLRELTASVSRLDEHIRAAVLLTDEYGKRFENVHSSSLPACFGEGVRSSDICELAIGTCGKAVFEGVPVTSADIAGDESWALAWRDLCVGQGMRACHSMPIFDPHGKAIGSFFLAFDQPGEPGQWHRRIAEFGAHVASIAVSNKRAEAAVRESEAELAQELADTRLLQGVSTELLSETNPDALYSRIVDAAAALMRSDAATLQMFHPERGSGGELRLLAYRGFPEEAARRREWIEVGSNTASGMALQRGKRIIIKDLHECAAVLGEEGVADYERSDIRAMQTTPLFARNGKLVGMLSTHWREPHEPSARRLGLLEVLGRQAADLIEGRRAEQKLLELNNFLERRVVERTADLVESERRVRKMASQLTMAEHAERRRISQIVHDDLQQQLHSIQMKLASARNALGRGEEARTLRHLNDAEQWSGEGVETARRLTVDLSPPILKSEGLAEALDWLVTQMREMHGLHVNVSGDRDLRMHDDAKRVLIYQIVRELLFNIVKHAGVHEARIELRRSDDTLDVCVLDEGKGFDPGQLRNPRPRAGGGFGLTSAHERLNLLGGAIEVDSAPGIGTAVVLHVPLLHNFGDAADEDVEVQPSGTEDLFG